MREPYLGIEIDLTRDELLTDDVKRMLAERYLVEGETSPQHAFARAATAYADDKHHAQRIYDYASNHWFMFATPILSNGGTSRGLPISCFLSYVGDSRRGLSDHYDELIWLVSNGGGVGGYWGGIRSNGQKTSGGSKSSGSIPFMKVLDAQILAFNQGTCYLPGHEVLTRHGWKRFEDLVGGETLFQVDENGDWSTHVLDVSEIVRESYDGDVVSISKDGKAVLKVTSNHKLALWDGDRLGLFEAGTVDFSSPALKWATACRANYNETLIEFTNFDPDGWLQAQSALKGRTVEYGGRSSNGTPSVIVRPDPREPLNGFTKTVEKMTTPVFCVEVPNKRLIVRYGNFVSLCGNTRRGSYAVYSDISHPEIEEFLVLRKPTGGDANRKCLNLNHAINITDDFMRIIERCMENPHEDDSWNLIDPHSGTVVKTVSARDLWQRIIETRIQTGEPYIHFIDRSNEALPQPLKDRGLRIHQSNLCTEILEPTNEHRTAVCCLSSVNLEKWEEWKDHDTFIQDLVRFLDNTLTSFISHVFSDNTVSSLDMLEKTHQDPKVFDYLLSELCTSDATKGLRRAAWSAHRERSIGLGAMGFHSYLQKNGIPFESAIAMSVNKRMFEHIKSKAVEESRRLAEERGEAPDMAGSGMRHAHLLAVAPNASSSYICGNTSPSIELLAANSFVAKTLSGSFLVKNKYLEKLLEERNQNTSDVWKSILENGGSVQHLEFLDDWERSVFKTSMEVDQEWVIEHAAMRQPFICQGQSLNLFFRPDEAIRYVHDVHFQAWKKGLKTLYYCRSESLRRSEKVGSTIERKKIETSGEGCISCEG